MTVKQSRLGKQAAQRMCCGNMGAGVAVGFVQEMRKPWKQRRRDKKTQRHSRGILSSPGWLKCRVSPSGEMTCEKLRAEREDTDCG